MINSLDHDQEQQDNRLAAFTDRALAAGQGEILPHSSDDPELAELERTVMQLKSLLEADAIGAVQQRASAQNRIYPRVAQQWAQEQRAAAPRPVTAPLAGTQKRNPVGGIKFGPRCAPHLSSGWPTPWRRFWSWPSSSPIYRWHPI
jgi:hypothetical protein